MNQLLHEMIALVIRLRTLEKEIDDISANVCHWQERALAAEAVCEAASSVITEDSIRDDLQCYVMGIALIERLDLWHALKQRPSPSETAPPPPEEL